MGFYTFYFNLILDIEKSCNNDTDFLYVFHPASPNVNILFYHSAIIQTKKLTLVHGIMWTMKFQMFKLLLEKAEEPEIKLPTSAGSLKKQESSRKTSALLTMPKPLTVDHKKLWKILKEMGIPDYLTCLWRNLYAGQEAAVRTGHGTTDWFQIGKGVHQGCVLSPCLFNFYAEYIMRNAGLEEAQAGIKIAGRNINNLRYADDITLMQKAKKN